MKSEYASHSALSTFEQETLPHKPVLYQAAYSRLGCRGEAEDAVQETYLQAWKSFERFQPGTNCRAWMFAILLNVVRHQRRKWIYRVRLTGEVGVFDRSVPAAVAVCEHLTDPEILAALRQLPPSYAAAIILADVQELSYKEIVHALGWPMGTVMSRISRGRELLRKSLTARAARCWYAGNSAIGE